MKYLIAFLFALITSLKPVHADENILMTRVSADFMTTMKVLQANIEAYGYKVSHVQRCDGGLKLLGYETDFYRVIFFGKPDEVRRLSKKYPEMVPFLPMKIAVVAEENHTLVSIFNPQEMGRLFQKDDSLRLTLARWKQDFVAILNDTRKESDNL